MSDKYLPEKFAPLSREDKIRMIAGSLERRGEPELTRLVTKPFEEWDFEAIEAILRYYQRGYVHFMFLAEPSRLALTDLGGL